MRQFLRRCVLHPIGFAVWPVVFLLAHNARATPGRQAVVPFVVFAMGGAVLLVVMRCVLRRWAAAGIATSALVVLFSSYGHVADVTKVPSAALLSLWALLAAGAVVMAIRVKGNPTATLNVVAVVLVAMPAAQVLSVKLAAAPRASAAAPAQAPSDARGVETSAGTPTAAGTPVPAPPVDTSSAVKPQRDIWYIVPDQYAGPATMQTVFGLDNQPLNVWLRDRGFAVAQDAAANYGMTSQSVAAALRMDYINFMETQPGDMADQSRVHSLLVDAPVVQRLRSQGYRYVHVGSWWQPKFGWGADEELNYDAATEFGWVLRQSTLLRALPIDGFRQDVYKRTKWQFDQVERVHGEPGPKLVLMHVLAPHGPWVFDDKGDYVSERREFADKTGAYRREVEYLNAQLRRTIETLQSGPEATRPIILLQADEGPYPVDYDPKDGGYRWSAQPDATLRHKFLIMSALYDPDHPGQAPRSQVNAFRIIFGLPQIEDRSFIYSDYKHWYRFIDITGRLRRGQPPD